MFEQPTFGTPVNGYQYNGLQPNTVKFNNTLTAEQIKRLQAKESQFTLAMTEEEHLRGICNHRNAEGTGDTLVYDPISGEAHCTICGYGFRPVDNKTPEDIKEDVSTIVDILQTIKLMYIDLPADVAAEYFKIIPLIEKIPALFDFAGKNMSKHDAYNWQYNNRNMGTVAMFNNLTSMLGGLNGMAGFNAQPQMMNPAFAQQPAGFPQAAYPQATAFGYPGASYVPGTNPGFAYAPNQQPAAVAPTAAPVAPAPAEATVTQTVTI